MCTVSSNAAIRWTDDWRAYGIVHAAAYRSAYRGLMEDDYLSQCTIELREPYYRSSVAAGRTAILSVDGKDAGCLAVRYVHEQNGANGRVFGEIDAIYLLPEYRGAGYGQQLLAWALERFREQQCGGAVLWVLERNAPAIRFYERSGFIRDGAARTIERGEQYEQIRMAMRL